MQSPAVSFLLNLFPYLCDMKKQFAAVLHHVALWIKNNNICETMSVLAGYLQARFSALFLQKTGWQSNQSQEL